MVVALGVAVLVAMEVVAVVGVAVIVRKRRKQKVGVYRHETQGED